MNTHAELALLLQSVGFPDAPHVAMSQCPEIKAAYMELGSTTSGYSHQRYL